MSSSLRSKVRCEDGGGGGSSDGSVGTGDDDFLDLEFEDCSSESDGRRCSLWISMVKH